MSAAPGLRAVAGPVSATLAIQTAVAFAVFAPPVLAPVAAPALGLPPAAIGWFVALIYLGSMAGSVLGGGSVARFGPIRMSQAGLTLAALGLALAASGAPLLVALGAFVLGLGYGPTTPSSSQILVRAAPPSLVALTFSIKQTGVPAGGVLAGVLVPALVLGFGWQGAALAVGACCALLALGIRPLRARWDGPPGVRAPLSAAAILAPLAFVLREPGLRRMAVASFVYGAVQISFTTFLVTFLTDAMALSLVAAGLVMAAAQVAGVAGRIAWGVIADRGVSRRAMLGALGLAMAACAAATLAASPAWPAWLLYAFAVAFGATAVGWNGVFLAEVAAEAGAARAGAATGGCLFYTYLGLVLAPAAFNLLYAASGSYAVAFALLGVPAVAVGVSLLRAR